MAKKCSTYSYGGPGTGLPATLVVGAKAPGDYGIEAWEELRLRREQRLKPRGAGRPGDADAPPPDTPRGIEGTPSKGSDEVVEPLAEPIDGPEPAGSGTPGATEPARPSSPIEQVALAGGHASPGGSGDSATTPRPAPAQVSDDESLSAGEDDQGEGPTQPEEDEGREGLPGQVEQGRLEDVFDVLQESVGGDDLVELAARFDEMRLKIGSRFKGLDGLSPKNLALDKLATHANAVHRKGIRSSTCAAYELGLVLCLARRLKAGRYQKFVREKCRFSYSSAVGYTRLVDRWEKLIEHCEGDLQRVVGLPLREALALVAEPGTKSDSAKQGVTKAAKGSKSARPAPRAIPDEATQSEGPGDAGPTTEEEPRDEGGFAPTGTVGTPGPGRSDRSVSRSDAKRQKGVWDPAEGGADRPVARDSAEDVRDSNSDSKMASVPDPALHPAGSPASAVTEDGVQGEAVEPDPSRLGRMLDVVEGAILGTGAHADSCRRLWVEQRDRRERLAVLMMTEDPWDLIACNDCQGCGSDPAGRACGRCKGLGLDHASGVDQPADEGDSAEGDGPDDEEAE